MNAKVSAITTDHEQLQRRGRNSGEATSMHSAGYVEALEGSYLAFRLSSVEISTLFPLAFQLMPFFSFRVVFMLPCWGGRVEATSTVPHWPRLGWCHRHYLSLSCTLASRITSVILHSFNTLDVVPLHPRAAYEAIATSQSQLSLQYWRRCCFQSLVAATFRYLSNGWNSLGETL